MLAFADAVDADAVDADAVDADAVDADAVDADAESALGTAIRKYERRLEERDSARSE